MHNEKRNKKNEIEKLTVEKLRKFKGFENISDDEATELISSYRIFSSITYNCFQKYIIKQS